MAFLFGFLLWPARAGLPEAQGIPSTDSILAKAVERASWAEKEGFFKQYQYTRRTYTDEFNPDGSIREKSNRTYEVLPFHGSTYSRLVKINGESLRGVEIKNEREREHAWKTKLEQNGAQKEKREISLTQEIVRRYQYILIGSEMVRDRLSYRLSFSPKTPRLPEDEFLDRVLNRMAGTVWIDAETFEVAQIDAHLVDRLNVGWGGVLASVYRVSLLIERAPLADGIWLTTSTDGELHARQVVITKHYKHREVSTDFVRQVSLTSDQTQSRVSKKR